jgi:cytochrome c-type biogenesis protein CcmH/NrfG
MNKFYRSMTPLLLLFPMMCAHSAETTDKTAAPAGDMKMNQGMGMQPGMRSGMGMQQGMGMGMGPGMTEEQKDQQLRAFQDHLLKMHELSDQILSEKDPAKKEELKAKQRELMKAHQTQMMEHRMQRMMQHQQKPQSEPKNKQ